MPIALEFWYTRAIDPMLNETEKYVDLVLIILPTMIIPINLKIKLVAGGLKMNSRGSEALLMRRIINDHMS